METKIFAIGQAAAIVLAGLWVFSPAMRGDWIWDDAAEVSSNLVLRDSGGLGKIWVSPNGPDYFPLKTTVQWVEWRIWGDSRLGYHLTSVFLHLLSALLFWRLLRRLFDLEAGSSASLSPSASLRASAFGAWFGGLLFAVHPLTVESVAWIAELKNTLSLAFLLGAMLAWVEFDRRWSALSPTRLSNSADEPARWGQRAPPFYWPSVLLFLAAMLSKSTVAMFPCVLLLYAWWRRGRIGRADLIASLPFFAVSLGLGFTTIWFQHHRAIAGADLAIGGFWPRLAGAGLALAFYAGKWAWPLGLIPIYPRWNLIPPSPLQFLPWAALSFVVAWLWTKRTGWGRHAIFGLGFFLLNLLPVLGFVPMAYLRISWVSDHLVYVPMLGLIGLAAAGTEALVGRLRPERAAAAMGIAVGLGGLLAFESHRYAGIFRNDEALWTYTLRHNGEAWLAHDDLGLVLAGAGRLPEAIDHYEAALRLRPDFPEAHNNLGNALAMSGRLRAAIEQFAEALRSEPNYVAARVNLGNALVQSGRFEEAIAQYEQVLRLKPGDAETRAALGFALAASGRLPEAIAQFGKALSLKPDSPRVRNSLGIALARSGQLAEAIGQFEEAIRLNPTAADVHANLGVALRDAGRLPEAEAQFAEAERLRSGP